MNTIFIDSGTTNSRIRLTKLTDSRIIDSLKLDIGVRNTAIDGNNKLLKEGLKKGILEVLDRNSLKPSDISYIVASGMITSNLGLYEVPHITSPASIEDYAENTVLYRDEDFLDIKILFIPGMKNNTAGGRDIVENINDYDIMRGEEVETIGLLEQIELCGNGIMVLPGSHTKYIYINEDKEMVFCLSTLAGEALRALQSQTILSKSLDKSLIRSLDKDMLRKGYLAAEEFGITRALYHVRLLDVFSQSDKNQIANYYTGALIHDDIKALLNSVKDEEKIDWLIIGGSKPLKNVFSYLIQELGFDWNIIEASDEQVEYSTLIGSKSIANRFMNKKIR